MHFQQHDTNLMSLCEEFNGFTVNNIIVFIEELLFTDQTLFTWLLTSLLYIVDLTSGLVLFLQFLFVLPLAFST